MKNKKPKEHHGSLKDQAPSEAYADAGSAFESSKIAKYGRDHALHRTYLEDCKLAFKHCPEVAPTFPAGTDPALRAVLELGWRMVRALKQFRSTDQQLIIQLMKVRGGTAFRQYVTTDVIHPADPLRTALADLALEQEAKTLSVLNDIKGVRKEQLPVPMTMVLVRAWLSRHSSATAVDDKTLRQACKDVGVVTATRGAPKRRRYGKLKRT